ncbi:glycoside hydrolase family 17 protein [Annulohypoxylon truncatum]|uniref:glycoside hydrolase family 17 protein n=1 Tax=Annulohypoxylon truncatum TaxID=327061 RepID=UPI00200882F8|nr:glycoside hydrolase family 17 protein [Annulohypoxylon truncatum]KAI1212127.1 glycoside hydrolase family 17 protein [Annulohypoxylon truncatum]
MGRRYSFDSDPGEHAPLDDPNDPYFQRQAHSNHYLNRQQQSPSRSRPSSPSSQPPSYRDSNSVTLSSEPYHHHHGYNRDHDSHPSPTRARPPSHPSAHPDSAFNRLRQNRRYSGGAGRAAAGTEIGAGAAVGALAGREVHDVAGSSSSRPIPPPHRENSVSTWGPRVPQTNVTPGADNFSNAAVGGVSGLAMSVAERNARESGLEAMRQPQHQQPIYPPEAYQDVPSQHHTYDDPRGSYGNDRSYDMPPSYGPNPYSPAQGYNSSPSLAPMGAAALTQSGRGTPTRSVHSYSSDPFRDPHMAYGQRMDPYLGVFNPNDIDDDGDDGLEYRRSARNSILSLGGSHNRGSSAAAGVAGAAAAGGVMGGLMGRSRNSGVAYDPVQNANAPSNLAGAGGYEMGAKSEKQSEWLSGQNSSKKKWKWFILILVGLIIAGGIAGGIVGGLLAKNKKGSGGGADGVQSADSDYANNGDLDINSDEIQALMNNPNLHKVFPGVDYTPINVQYPDCLKNPPSQNNVTRDVAVLSQLTNTIRLYGTDCNQTEMTIHALKQLKLDTEIKIWLGVWQDNNDTTNKRQLSRMWNILDEYGAEPFKGLIIGNEILFRKQMTATQLSDLLDSVRSNLTSHNWKLPVATSDLGDNWDSQLAQISDYIMGNIHPFFAGVNAKEAASWTWSFWHNKAESFFKTDNEKNVISEIGWPTKGGTDCGDDSVTSCPDGSVAGIDELNTLMEGWVCQALANGTNYFWFEMFDEPWKISFDTPGKEWEDQWGLMDVNRNLKAGVKIPDCGGKTV